MGKIWKHYTKWEKPGRYTRTNTVWFHWHEIPKIVKFIEKERRMVVAGGRGNGNILSMGTDFQFYKMKRGLWMDGSDGCTLRMYWMGLNWTLKNGSDGEH